MLEEAKNLSKEVLRKFPRLSGETYFDHVDEVVTTLVECGIDDENLLTSAYLDHIYELDPDSYDLIKEQFGEDIANITQKYHRLAQGAVKNLQPETTDPKHITACMNFVEDPRILIMRLADRVSNIGTAHHLDKSKVTAIANKAMNVYSPIAHVLGLNGLAAELENHSLRLINPERYYHIKHYLRDKEPLVTKFFDEIEQFIKEILAENDIDTELSYRLKNTYSVHRKAVRLGLAAEDVCDLVAMRILVDTVEQCYLVEDILAKLWQPYPESRNDYIAKPKPNGYQSIQSIYKVSPDLDVEIQIRTHDMHEQNEFGQASHIIYKLGKDFKKLIDNNPDYLKDINIQRKGMAISPTHDKTKIHVFTPKGDIIELPKGATVVDFAYQVHAELGHGCEGAFINGVFKGVRQELTNGDVVRVKMSKKLPNRNWLEFVKTKKARDHIKRALRAQNT